MSVLNNLNRVNFENAEITLWVFKKPNMRNNEMRFSGSWVETSEEVNNALKSVMVAESARIEEVEEYGLLAENNEASALSISADETYVQLVTEAVSEHAEGCKAKSIKKLRPSEFYVIKVVVGDQKVYAFRKTDKSWKTKKSVSFHFSDETLTIDPSPSMDLSPFIDFFVVGNDILILNKANFESILMYKEAHKDAFEELKVESEFVQTFSALDGIEAYVGTNKIQLRRAHAIQQKGHYKDSRFMARLKARCAEFNLTINFDDHGKIIPCENTCRDIFQALLDHRLSSAFSESIYDVPHATKVTAS